LSWSKRKIALRIKEQVISSTLSMHLYTSLQPPTLKRLPACWELLDVIGVHKRACADASKVHMLVGAGDVKTLAFSNFSHALVGQTSGKGASAVPGYKSVVVDHSKQV